MKHLGARCCRVGYSSVWLVDWLEKEAVGCGPQSSLVRSLGCSVSLSAFFILLFKSQQATKIFFISYQSVFTLELSWQQWSGPSRLATWWHEHTHQVKTHCRIHCPKTQYQPESKFQPSHRPEDRQSHPERGQTASKQQARTICMHQHVPAGGWLWP